MHVALVTYDNSVHFYALRAEQSAFQMLVVPDAQQPLLPRRGLLPHRSPCKNRGAWCATVPAVSATL